MNNWLYNLRMNGPRNLRSLIAAHDMLLAVRSKRKKAELDEDARKRAVQGGGKSHYGRSFDV